MEALFTAGLEVLEFLLSCGTQYATWIVATPLVLAGVAMHYASAGVGKASNAVRGI